MLLHGLDSTIQLWDHTAMNICISSLFSEQKEAGLLVLYSTNSFCSSQSLGSY